MKSYIEFRVNDVVAYVIENSSTIRAAAKHFMIAKSTVYKDITVNILEVCPKNIIKINEVLALHKSKRSAIGGEATRLKYLSGGINRGKRGRIF